MDVTDQITLIKQTYGGSDNTAPGGLAASKNLNYAKGASITNAPKESVTVIPFTLNYKDTVGLFGAENTYIKVDIDIKDSGMEAYAEPGWEALTINYYFVGTDPYYIDAVIDNAADLNTVNDYEPALISNILVIPWNPMVKISLVNNKTGNIYNDNWFDVRLYTNQREEHAFDEMYIHQKDYFYIGFHARNTRRLPYNVSCTIGTEFVSIQDIIDKQLIAKEI